MQINNTKSIKINHIKFAKLAIFQTTNSLTVSFILKASPLKMSQDLSKDSCCYSASFYLEPSLLYFSHLVYQN